MGAVYAARHVRTGGSFAVKVLHLETAADAEIYKRFQDEARTISALRHPHIVQVTDFDRDDDGTPFIVMELLEGEDLYQRLCRVGKLPLEQVLEIARQVGSALFAAHEKGVIHRDIKPQNIFLVRHELADMVSEVAKVVDFGISKIRRTGGQMTRDMTILGTPQFMSPEAALGQNSQLDGRADQWSLAVIMYLALSGKLPFDGENLVGVLYMVVHEQPTPLKQLAPEVPDHVIAAISRAMSKKKDERFPRMAEFVRALVNTGTATLMRQAAGLQMNSAVIPLQAPLAAQTQSPLEPTTPPARVIGPAPVIPPFMPHGPDAATVTPNRTLGIDAHADLSRMQAGASSEPCPPGAPTTPQSELLATPNAPTALAPLLAEATRVTAKPHRHSGDTPTNLSLTPEALQEHLNEKTVELSQAAAKLAERTADSAITHQDAALAESERESSLSGVDSTDLQAVPTRVASVPGFGPAPQKDTAAAPADNGFTTTLPPTPLRKPETGSAIDTAYPSTLSRAIGQTGPTQGTRSALARLKDINWMAKRDHALALLGVRPRSPGRLAIAASAATLALLFVVLVWGKMHRADLGSTNLDPKVAAPQPRPVESGTPSHLAAAPDGGTGPESPAKGLAKGTDPKEEKEQPSLEAPQNPIPPPPPPPPPIKSQPSAPTKKPAGKPSTLKIKPLLF